MSKEIVCLIFHFWIALPCVCPSSEDLRGAELSTWSNSIQKTNGVASLFKSRKRPRAPAYMKHLYRKLKMKFGNQVFTRQDLDRERHSVPKIIGLSALSTKYSSNNWIYVFNMTTISGATDIRNADLVLSRHFRKCRTRRCRIPRGSLFVRNMTSARVHTDGDHIVADVTELVKKARTNHEPSFALVVEINVSKRQWRVFRWSAAEVLLVVYENIGEEDLRRVSGRGEKFRSGAETPGRSRRGSEIFRRNTNYSEGTDTWRGICRVHEWYVEFARMGWSWIQQPNWYRANYCSGSCMSINDRIDNQAFIRNVYHWKTEYRERTRVPLPCCVPSAFSALSILGYDSDSDSFVVTNLSEMTVEQCKCY